MIRMHEDLGWLLKEQRGFAVAAIDPGETSAIAYACLAVSELRTGVVSALRAARNHSSGLLSADRRFDAIEVGRKGTSPWPISEIEVAEALLLYILMYGNMASRTSRGVVSSIQVVVIEDFVPALSNQERSFLSPVRIAVLLCQLLHHRDELYHVVFQSSSNAMSTVTDERLKKWNLYLPGSEHRKDALRHMILWLRTLMNDG